MNKMSDEDAIQFYGADAAEWLRRWDAGDIVWSVEMGGLGPGYEQCIQVTCAEILRHMLAKQYDAEQWSDKDAWAKDRDDIEAMMHTNEVIKALGLSGAQWGAALNIAGHLYRRGPATCLRDESIQDRKIQVSRNFPRAA